MYLRVGVVDLDGEARESADDVVIPHGARPDGILGEAEDQVDTAACDVRCKM